MIEYPSQLKCKEALMNRITALLGCAALAAVFGAEAGTNPAGRPTGLDRALTRMNAQGLAHQQATLRANPAARNPNAATPATPAVPATPGTDGGPATPATPAIPATPAKPPKPPKPHGD